MKNFDYNKFFDTLFKCLLVVFVVLGTIGASKELKKDYCYKYVDLDGEKGVSEKCYISDGGLLCEDGEIVFAVKSMEKAITNSK